MTMRFFVGGALVPGTELTLPPAAARHAQVRRVQPGWELVLFDGQGSDWPATVLAVGRSSVRVRVGAPVPVHNELPLRVTLALVMPANERMDTVVEKATELGVAAIQPLHSTRSVLRLAGERADRKQAHWQAIAQAACEQCSRARVPAVAPVRELMAWLQDAAAGTRLVLSLQPDAAPLHDTLAGLAGLEQEGAAITTLSGPEGGLAPEEEAAARAAGFMPTTLGRRVLRADTAPLAVLAWLALGGWPGRKSG